MPTSPNESCLGSQSPFPVKRISVALTVCLDLIFNGLYSAWWFFSRRESLNALHGTKKLPLWMTILFLVAVTVRFAAGIGAAVFLDRANMHDSSGYFRSAQIFHIIKAVAGYVTMGLLIFLSFRVKAVLDAHQKRQDAFSIPLSGWFTFLFGIFYLQYSVNQLHLSAGRKKPVRFCSPNEWLCILYASTAVFLVVFADVAVLYGGSFIRCDVSDSFTYLLVLCVFAVKLITDRYTGDWNSLAKKIPLFLIAAFIGGGYCGVIAGNNLRPEERLLASTSKELQVKAGSEACDLTGRLRYVLGSKVSYLSRLRKRNDRLEWVVFVTSESYSKRWVIDAETGEILSPNPLPRNYKPRGDLHQ